MTQQPATHATSDEATRLKQVGQFLAEYASYLFDSGATCIRMERNINRMAKALNCEAVMTILPRHIHISVGHDGSQNRYTFITAVKSGALSYNINTRLSQLSWELGDGKIDFEETQRRFEQIIHTPPTNQWTVLVLASIANGAFCRLFGGDWIAVLVVIIATMVGFRLKQIMGRKHVDVRLIFVCCAFVSSMLAACCGVFHWGTTPDIAMGTAVLYLVPGIIYLNSFSDLLAGHYICAVSRFIHAVILTCCLSLGLCAGMLAMNMGMF